MKALRSITIDLQVGEMQRNKHWKRIVWIKRNVSYKPSKAFNLHYHEYLMTKLLQSSMLILMLYMEFQSKNFTPILILNI